jgi:two-component system KDP operon response regulator KdpE
MDNILIIDDNVHLLESLAAVIGMQSQDYTILTAKNGLEGITAIDSRHVAFILTDLDMPIMDGYAVINHRNRSCPQVPLFVMSGSLSPEVMEKLGELCVSGCIEKPFSFRQIRDTIALAMNVESIDTGIDTDADIHTLARPRQTV